MASTSGPCSRLDLVADPSCVREQQVAAPNHHDRLGQPAPVDLMPQQRPVFAFLHVPAEFLGLLEGQPNRASVTADFSGGPELKDVDSLVGFAVMPQGAGGRLLVPSSLSLLTPHYIATYIDRLRTIGQKAPALIDEATATASSPHCFPANERLRPIVTTIAPLTAKEKAPRPPRGAAPVMLSVGIGIDRPAGLRPWTRTTHPASCGLS
jgi:hypothetical protein